jgi:hypothetical protein
MHILAKSRDAREGLPSGARAACGRSYLPSRVAIEFGAALSCAPFATRQDVSLRLSRRPEDEAVVMRQRRRLLQTVVYRLEAEGRLADGWTAEEAADFLWATTSTWTYQALVVERGWSQERLVEQLKVVLRGALVRASTQS